MAEDDYITLLKVGCFYIKGSHKAKISSFGEVPASKELELKKAVAQQPIAISVRLTSMCASSIAAAS